MFNRPYVVMFFAALALLPAASSVAQAADLAVTDAKIAGGKLVVTGTTATPNTWVRLDGQTATDFNIKSSADGTFAFGIVYHPGDCIVDLQRLISPVSLGAATPALVADCGPRGVSPRGGWNATAPYLTNDLVTYLGSTWRAKRNNTNKQPVAGTDWELFAAGATEAAQASNGSGVEPMDAPDGPAGGDLTGTYPNPTIANGVVTNAKIAPLAIGPGRLADSAVTEDKIADGAVVTAKIAPLAIGSGRLGDNAVTNAKIADDAVAGAEVLDASIANADLAPDAVSSATVLDSSLTGIDVANSSLTGDDILDAGIANADLAADAVNSAAILDSSIAGIDVANSSLTGDDIASSSLTGIDVANGSLTGSDILDESLGTSDIADGSLNTADLAISSVTGSRIAAGAVTSSDIANRTVNADDMDAADRSGSIDVGAISNGHCTTITGSVSGMRPGDVAILTTNGTLPNGMLVYAQRALTDSIHIKVCNLTGATSAAISDLPVRVLAFH